MITVHAPPGAWGLPSISPFCSKLDLWLRIAGIPFTVSSPSPIGAPKGKMPYIDDGASTLGDSQLIIQHLSNRHGVQLDGGLSPAALAQGHALRRMLEEGTYFVLVYTRWVEPASWAVYRPIFLKIMPPVVGPLIVYFLRRKVRAALHAQGTGRHTRDEVQAMGIADFQTVASVLGDRPYLLGDEPRSVDATVYAFVAGMLSFPVDSPIRSYLLSQPNLVAYCERIRARYYPDVG